MLICSISLLQCAHRAVLCSVLTIVFGFKCLTVFVVVVPATCLPSIHCFPLSIITASNAEILTIKLCLTKLESIHKEGSSISVSPQLTRGSLKWVSCQYLGPAMSTCMAVPESSQACQTPMKTSTMARCSGEDLILENLISHLLCNFHLLFHFLNILHHCLCREKEWRTGAGSWSSCPLS